MIERLALLMVVALAPAGSSLELTLPAAQAPARDETHLPWHLFSETLRGPFGQDWGGETFLYAPVGARLSAGLFMRSWSEATCASPSCAERAMEAGVELRYQVKPGVQLGVGLGAQRSPGARPAPSVLPRVHLRF